MKYNDDYILWIEAYVIVVMLPVFSHHSIWQAHGNPQPVESWWPQVPPPALNACSFFLSTTNNSKAFWETLPRRLSKNGNLWSPICTDLLSWKLSFICIFCDSTTLPTRHTSLWSELFGPLMYLLNLECWLPTLLVVCWPKLGTVLVQAETNFSL